MTSAKMVLRYSVEGGNYSRAGEAASKIKKALRQLGIDAELIRRVSIAAYEGEMNIVIHAEDGELILQVGEEEITVTAQDKGPGIVDVGLAMQEGYSTAPDSAREMGFGAGMGLPNMEKCTDQMEIKSVVNQGTKVVMTFVISKDKRQDRRGVRA